MNAKRAILAGLAAIVVHNLLQYLGHSVWLMQDYRATAGLWRPEEQVQGNFLLLANTIYAAIFTRIFVTFHEHRGIIDGVRFGNYATWLVSLPYVLTQYAVTPLPPTLAAKWLALGFVQNVALGVVVAAVYGKQSQAANASSAGS